MIRRIDRLLTELPPPSRAASSTREDALSPEADRRDDLRDVWDRRRPVFMDATGFLSHRHV